MNATTLIQLSPADLEQLLSEAVRKALEAEHGPQGFLRTKEAADFLGLTPEGLRQAEKRGQIPSHRLGARVLYDPVELRDFVKSGQAAA
jgi:Helix-turn-helix domain